MNPTTKPLITPKRIILLFALIISIITFALIGNIHPTYQETIKLVQYFGFISMFFLYASLFAGPFYRLFPEAPYKALYRSSLSGLGISTFYFALLHGAIAFWGLLQGWNGLAYLGGKYLLSITAAFIALLILAAMAGTSFDKARIKLGTYWKKIHQTIYIGAFLMWMHIIISGSHFRNLASPFSLFWIALFTILIGMHAALAYKKFSEKYPTSHRLVQTVIFASLILIYTTLYNLHGFIHGSHLH